MPSNSSSSSGGVGFFGLLTIAFIVLKLMGHITWSWVWVLAPTWMPLALMIIVIVFFGLLIKIGDKS
jgi:hypothetical protein